MTIEEAATIACAIAACWDPPVIKGIFDDINEEIPEFKFEYGEDSSRPELPFMEWVVTELSTGKMARSQGAASYDFTI